MLKLEINNSLCQISGFNLAQFKEIRSILSYSEMVKGRYGRMTAVTRYLITKRGVFPTGLLKYVDTWILDSKSQVLRSDTRIRPKTQQLGLQSLFISGRSPNPYPEQLEASKACLSIKDGRGIVVAPTGTGKSLIAALICDALQVPTLIIVPSLELKTQTTSTLQYYFGKDKVGPLNINGTKKFFITVENYDALDTNKPIEGVDCTIIDEYHHAAAKSIRTLSEKAWKNVYFRFGLTATPMRSKSEEKILLESIIAPVIYRIEYKTAVKKGYIAPLEGYFCTLPNVKLTGNIKNYASMYSELVVNRQDRNELIVDFAASLHDQNIPTLILVKQIEHGKALQKMLADKGYSIPFANGQDNDSRMFILQFNLKEIPVLIGSSIIGEGIDSKPCEWVILAGGTGKSRVQLMQNCGRAFRRSEGKESGKVLVIKDSSHKWFIDHFKEFCKTLDQEYGIVPAKLEIK